MLFRAYGHFYLAVQSSRFLFILSSGYGLLNQPVHAMAWIPNVQMNLKQQPEYQTSVNLDLVLLFENNLEIGFIWCWIAVKYDYSGLPIQNWLLQFVFHMVNLSDMSPVSLVIYTIGMRKQQLKMRTKQKHVNNWLSMWYQWFGNCLDNEPRIRTLIRR